MLLKTYVLMDRYRRDLIDQLKQEEGQDLIEYALLVALISVVAVTAIGAAGDSVDSLFTHVQDELKSAVTDMNN